MPAIDGNRSKITTGRSKVSKMSKDNSQDSGQQYKFGMSKQNESQDSSMLDDSKLDSRKVSHDQTLEGIGE